MDDDGLPLSSPLPLSQPAVQAPNENPDAIIPSETRSRQDKDNARV